MIDSRVLTGVIQCMVTAKEGGGAGRAGCVCTNVDEGSQIESKVMQ